MIKEKIDQEKIIKLLSKHGPCSLTAISKLLGYTKKGILVERLINDMEKSGLIKYETVAGVKKYSVINVVKSNSSTDADVSSETPVSSVSSDSKESNTTTSLTEGEGFVNIPEDLLLTSLRHQGKIYLEKSADGGYDITFPAFGGHTHVNYGEKLLVIAPNDSSSPYVAKVSSLDDILLNINKYVKKNGLVTFGVTQVGIGTPKSLRPDISNIENSSVILWLNVTRQMKAGLGCA